MAACHACGKELPAGEFPFCPFCTAPLADESREQRKTVTVLFCDVTGSTAMGEQLDPEALRALLARYFERMKAIVERHGGTVEKFIGDAVMAVFGVPVVHEDDAIRALRAAVEMRDALPELGLEGRVGVNTGEVVTGTAERLATGDAVNVAARLQQVAQPGDVLIGEDTLRLARGAVEAEALQPFALKGKAEPVAAHRLLSLATEAPRRQEGPMVGRAREMRLLADAWERVVSERSCHLFTILGAAGVGKSRLAAEFLVSLGDVLVVSGRCLPYGEGITYWPVAEVVKQLPELAADPGAARTLEALVGDQELVTSSEEIARAFRRQLEAAAMERPLVCVFDDLHWGEETFLDLVEQVADFARDAAILLLCMARPDLLDRRTAWGGGKVNATSVLLEPLAPDETERLIEQLADLDPGLRGRITEAAEGNPLYVEEMVALVEASGAGEVRVPPTIQALLAARLDQLTPQERDVLQRGSVEGRVFHLGAVQALAPAEAQPRARLTALVRKELVRPDRPEFAGEDAYRFRHLLIRDAAYDSLPKATRAQLHQGFAAWLEVRAAELIDPDGLVGYHLEQACRYRAQLGETDDLTDTLAREAARRLGAAGGRAFQRSDPSAGVNLVSRAAALLTPDDPMRVALVPNVRAVQGLGVDLTWADRVLTEAVEAAAESGDRRLAAHALVQRGLLRLFTDPEVTPDELIDAADRALLDLDDELGIARAWRLKAQAHYLARGCAASAAASEQALEHVRRSGDRFEEGEIVEWLVIALLLGPTPAVEAAERCRQLLQETSDPLLEAEILAVLAPLEAMLGNRDEAAELVARSRETVAEWIWLASFWGALIAIWQGDPIEAERELRPAYDALKQTGEKSHFSTMAHGLANVLYAQGRYDEAEQLTHECEEASRENDVHSQISWRSVRAKALARRGELDAAEELAREAVAIALTSDFLLGHGDALADLAEVLELRGERAAAAAVALQEAAALFDQKGHRLAAKRTRAQLMSL